MAHKVTSMDTPMKSSVTTAGKSKTLPMGKGKHATGPVSNAGSGKVGQATLDGAHGNKGKYC